jgi:peptidoglycan/LPS O-acetylase OafA/YrhL
MAKMPLTLPRRNRFNVQLILGFLLGIVASLLCLFFSMFLGSTLAPQHARMYPVFTGIAVVALGLVALRNARRSSFALGVLIASALALLLDGASAIAGFK